MAGSDEFKDFLTGLLPQLLTLFADLQAFRQQPPTPERTCAFETATAAILRESGRVLVEHEYNRIEAACLDDCPFRLRFAGAEYRRRPKSPNQVGTLFGAVELRRYLYEAVEAGEPALFPLEQLCVPKTSSAGRIRRQKRWSALGASRRPTRSR
jgi:hypothetical protein